MHFVQEKACLFTWNTCALIVDSEQVKKRIIDMFLLAKIQKVHKGARFRDTRSVSGGTFI